ncbi:MAG: GtrA family protein [Anaerostipes sp.]|uniref:GtrA family protein n=1 Tax=Anaerostipes sp. 992a TaxID=1261637 RepID=UPI0009515167|nr:GtrA family protein [Anaerostipes sp. 992a]MCI5951444.1 GtrA family protein [Anaerostipes sp.]MDD5968729.1 GtrA family protein [Anaerostipes sp.]OLR62389.1 polysaccharide biosynthesis protein GtrA [Anaerostipes sp. 992a]
MKKWMDITFLKFMIVGVINTVFGTTVMFLSYNFLGFSYWAASAANYILGSILSYFLNKNFTFQQKEKSVKTVWKFALNITVCYLIAYGAAKPLIRMALNDADRSIRDNVAMLTGMCLFVVLNYFGQRFFAFAKKDNKELT